MGVDFAPKKVIVLRASADAGSTHPTSTPTTKNLIYKGVLLTIDLSAITGTSITFTINNLDPISGNAVILLASVAQTGAATIQMLVYPTVAAASNTVAAKVLGRDWNVTTAGTYTVATYSISAELIP